MKVLSMDVSYEIIWPGRPGQIQTASYAGTTMTLSIPGLTEEEAREVLVTIERSRMSKAGKAALHHEPAPPQDDERVAEGAELISDPTKKKAAKEVIPKAPEHPAAEKPTKPAKPHKAPKAEAAPAPVDDSPEEAAAAPKPAPPVTTPLMALVHGDASAKTTKSNIRELTEGERLEREGMPTEERIRELRALISTDPMRLKTMILKDVLVQLQDGGVKDADEMIAVCEFLRPEVPALSKTNGLPDRVRQTLAVI